MKQFLPIFEIAPVLVRFDHIARFIVTRWSQRGCAAEREKTERELLARALYELILYL